MIRLTVKDDEIELVREGDLVFGAAITWEESCSKADACIKGKINEEKFIIVFADVVAQMLASTVPHEYNAELEREFIKKFAYSMAKIREEGEKCGDLQS